MILNVETPTAEPVSFKVHARCCRCGREFGRGWRKQGVTRAASLTPRGITHFACAPCRTGGFDLLRHMIDHIQGVRLCMLGRIEK